MTTADISCVLDMLELLHAESPVFNIEDKDEAYVTTNLIAMLSNPTFIGVIDDAGRGFMIGYVVPSWYSPRPVAYEELLYVHPDNRGGILAARLVKSFEQRAKELGAPEARTGVSTLINMDTTARFYNALGYQPMSTGFRKFI